MICSGFIVTLLNCCGYIEKNVHNSLVRSKATFERRCFEDTFKAERPDFDIFIPEKTQIYSL